MPRLMGALEACQESQWQLRRGPWYLYLDLYHVGPRSRSHVVLC